MVERDKLGVISGSWPNYLVLGPSLFDKIISLQVTENI